MNYHLKNMNDMCLWQWTQCYDCWMPCGKDFLKFKKLGPNCLKCFKKILALQKFDYKYNYEIS